jgi:hypothetical protein
VEKKEPTLEVQPKIEAVYDIENVLITPEQASSNNQDEVDAWAEANDKALGNILLRLTPDIQYKYRDKTNAANLLKAIEKEYGKPGVIGIYLEFKHAMEVRIPEGQDPMPTLDKFYSHISRLESHSKDTVVSPFFKAMMVMSKLPPSYNNIPQVICQTDDISKLDTEGLWRAIILTWEQTSNGKGKQQAHKLSNVPLGTRISSNSSNPMGTSPRAKEVVDVTDEDKEVDEGDSNSRHNKLRSHPYLLPCFPSPLNLQLHPALA